MFRYLPHEDGEHAAVARGLAGGVGMVLYATGALLVAFVVKLDNVKGSGSMALLRIVMVAAAALIVVPAEVLAQGTSPWVDAVANLSQPRSPGRSRGAWRWCRSWSAG